MADSGGNSGVYRKSLTVKRAKRAVILTFSLCFQVVRAFAQPEDSSASPPAVYDLLTESALVSHQAVYDLFLESTEGGAGGVVNAQGTMRYSLHKACKEWKTETVFSLDVSYELNGIDTTHWKQETLESQDGCRFDFAVYTFSDGKDKTEFKGTAVCRGQSKEVAISEPLVSEASFPLGVRFPVQQTLLMLDAAKRGRSHVSSYIYDGTRLEGLYFMNAGISPAVFETGGKRSVAGDASLLDGKSYRFDTAFFNDTGLDGEKEKDGRPFYEASVRYYENGVSDDVVQDFGLYKLRSRLREIRRLSDEECSGRE